MGALLTGRPFSCDSLKTPLHQPQSPHSESRMRAALTRRRRLASTVATKGWPARGRPLAGLRVLLVEDAYLLASSTTQLLRGAGAEVVGPVDWLDNERDLVTGEERLSGAVLDVRPGEGWMAAPLAAELVARGVPVLLATADKQEVLPDALRALPRVCKPFGGELGRVAAMAFLAAAGRSERSREGHSKIALAVRVRRVAALTYDTCARWRSFTLQAVRRAAEGLGHLRRQHSLAEDRILATSNVLALLAVTGLAEDELAPFCTVAAAVLDGQQGLARGTAVSLWRGGHCQLSWAPAVRRLVLQTGPWAPPGGAVPTPKDVRAVEDALGLAEDGPARQAWRRELTLAGVGENSTRGRRSVV
jgi:hypothetical protein